MMIKSKKTTLKLLICVLAMLALATVLVACNIGYVPDDYDYLVTFEYNVGTGENALGTIDTQRIGVFENALVSIRPGYDLMKFPEGAVDGYYLEDWYLPAYIDENGEPSRDDKGFVILGEKWDFQTMRVNKDITLYGNFVKKFQVRFLYKNKDNQEEYINYYLDYKPGSRVTVPSDTKAPTLTGHTFLGKYYTSAERNAEFNWNFYINSDVDVYVEFLEGIWRLVKTASEFRTAIGANRNIYLMNDIDFAKESIWDFSNYTGNINGDGHKISNITRSIVAGKSHYDNRIDSFGGIFGSLGGEAHIYDITFENVNLTFDISPSYLSMDAYVGILAGKVDENVTLENVKITGSLTNNNKDNNKTVYVGKDTDYENIIGENKGNINDCDFNQEIAAA